MKGYTFDPSRLDRPGVDADKHVAEMLRDYMGGDPLEDARRRFRLEGELLATIDALRFSAARLRQGTGHTRGRP
jgi:hypothetical protein